MRLRTFKPVSTRLVAIPELVQAMRQIRGRQLAYYFTTAAPAGTGVAVYLETRAVMAIHFGERLHWVPCASAAEAAVTTTTFIAQRGPLVLLARTRDPGESSPDSGA